MTWKPGVSGNPRGRPKGAKDRLSQAVISELVEDWEKHGAAVIERVREEHPAQYLQFVGRVLPQNIEIDVDGRRAVVEYTSAELVELLEEPTQITCNHTEKPKKKAVSK